MATLAQGGRISTEIVHEEIERLNASWASLEGEASDEILGINWQGLIYLIEHN
jgi:sigma54-dependent transcription regulator